MLRMNVLGPVEVLRDGVAVDLGGPQQRAVVAHLALEAGRVVSVDRLIDRLWGDDPPRTPLGTLQSYVSRLRRALEPEHGAGATPALLVSEAPGYVLRIDPEQIDVHRFHQLLAAARDGVNAGDSALALDRYDEALALWRGPALSGIGFSEQVRTATIRLENERDAAVEQRFEVLLALGRHAEAIPAIQEAVDEQPLRERLWALLALGLYRSSRQADALRSLSSARATLGEELGLDPGPELRDLEARILAHDATLLLTTPVRAPAVAPFVETAAAPSVELVGRAREWRQLVHALDVATTRSALVLIEGEPGIGKSTVSEAFVAHASALGWRTAVGRCVEPGLAPTLWPCIEVARALITHGADVSDNPWGMLAESGGGPGNLTAVEMADHFIDLVDALGGQPCVIFVDDLHWADRGTLDLLALTSERLGARRVLMVLAHRPPEIVPGSLLGGALAGLHRSAVATERIAMSPLDVDEVAQLMEITAGAAPSRQLAGHVQARAAGNPLFVAELARLAGERGLRDPNAVPDAVRDVVRSRLAQMPDNATAELEVAAVIGERFDLRTAMAASEREPDACLDALDAAIVTRILVPDGNRFRFTHALVRDAVLASIAPLRLARLHHRVAEAIMTTQGSGMDQAEPIAHHRLAAGAFADPLVTAAAAARAADIARWRGAFDAADDYAEQALTVLSTSPRSAQVTKIEAEALESIVSVATRRADANSMQAAARTVGEAAERTGNDAAKALTIFLDWTIVDSAESLGDVVPYVERARTLDAATDDPYALVITKFLLGSYDMLVGRMTTAAMHIDGAIEASGGEAVNETPDYVPLVMLPLVAGVVAAMRGQVERARVHIHQRARAWLGERLTVDSQALTSLTYFKTLLAAILDEPRQVVHEIEGMPIDDVAAFLDQQAATCRLLGGWAHAELGDPSGVETAFAAMEHIELSEEQILRPMLRTFVGRACLAVGDVRAVDCLQRAADMAVARGELWWMAETLRLQALADERFAGGTRAGELLDRARAVAADQGSILLSDRLDGPAGGAGAP